MSIWERLANELRPMTGIDASEGVILAYEYALRMISK
jgi:hypothetical protein